ncbi:metal transporter [Flavobacterium agricola]|uniref:Metal transporter n=1 Tax=Flavobacterium agricola TaxID=2870839 RepID=A0ABY6LWD2_9FLAO|nr:metal transporter [Flavobacterium agricola]UYW00637.1 metal transporter [Flavobacterium agricola]
MKKILLLALLTFFGLQAHAQDAKSVSKTHGKYDIEVKGNCNMCKKRIEKAAYSVNGVRSAEWHADDQTLHVMLNDKKATPLQVQQAVAAQGHDTKFNNKDVKATPTDYENLHGCCLYERE